jgi:hypothetical protein
MGRVHLTLPRIRGTSSPPVASDFFARKNADNLATGGARNAVAPGAVHAVSHPLDIEPTRR